MWNARQSRFGRPNPVLALFGACLLWGTADVAGKSALETIPPITLTALRFLVASAILWPMARRSGVRVPLRDALPLGLIGIAGMFLLQNLGLSRIAAANASLLQGATPAVTLLVAALLIHERIGPRRALAIGAAATGVVVMSSAAGLGVGRVGLGDGLVLASMVMFGIFVVLGKPTFQSYGTIPVVFAISLVGSLALVPAAATEIVIVRPALPGASALLWVLYLSLGCSAVSYALWGYAVQHLAVGRVAAFDALIPLTGCMAAAMILDETLTRTHLVGGIAIVSGVILIASESVQDRKPAVKTDETTMLGTAAPIDFEPAIAA